MDEEQSNLLLQQLRDTCLRKGMGSIKGLGYMFRYFDKDYSKKINLAEFQAGMKAFGMSFTNDQVSVLFKHFDKDHSGHIDFGELLMELKPPLRKCRLDVINEAFDKLDVVKDDVLKIEDLKCSFREQALMHPKYRSGQWSLDQVYQSFLDAFDAKGNQDGVVSRDEFISYYATLSATIDDDSYFDLMMRNSWGLPQRSSPK